MRKRLGPDEIDELARRFEAGEPPSPGDLRALCEMARELSQAAPPQELVRLAMLLVSSHGALPLKPAQAEALGAAVLKAARGALMEEAVRALREANEALVLGKNWIDALDRVPLGSKLGQQVVGLAGSMTRTLHRHLVSTAESANFGMVGQIEALDPKEPGYKDIAPLENIKRRQCTDELEQAHETLRVARLGLLKVARVIHAISTLPPTRIRDETLAQQAALQVRDAEAHLAELKSFSVTR